MKNENAWRPTKFSYTGTRLRPGPDGYAGSWLVTQLIADFYQSELSSRDNGDLLDLGCGNAPLYAVYGPTARSITCVDWAESFHENPYLDLVHDLNRPLPFADSGFDTVVLSDVLEHIREPQELLCEIQRVLRQGGRLFANVPFLYWLHEVPHDYFRYTEHALNMMCEKAGLEVLLLEPIGGGPDVLADVLGKHIAQLPLIGGPIASILQRVTYFLLRSRPARKALRQSRERFPLGYCIIANVL